MIWKHCDLLTRIPVGKDVLGNEILETQVACSGKIRFTPWTTEEIQLEGREVTKGLQKVLLQLPFSKFETLGIRLIVISDRTLLIEKVKDLTPRFTLLYVKQLKG